MIHKATISFLLLIATFGFSSAQVVNGSFELGGNPTEEGWGSTCPGTYDTLIQDAPTGGGNWCLKLYSGDLDCSANYKYQIIPEVQNGDIWQVTVWAKSTSFSHSVDVMDWAIKRGSNFIFITTDEDTSNLPPNQWLQLSIVDTFFFTQPGDSAVVILNGGYSQSWVFSTFYDLVTVQKIGNVLSGVNENDNPKSPFIEYFLVSNLSDNTIQLLFTNNQTDVVSIQVQNVLGQKVAQIIQRQLFSAGKHELIWDTSDLPEGIYFITLKASKEKITRKALVLK